MLFKSSSALLVLTTMMAVASVVVDAVPARLRHRQRRENSASSSTQTSSGSYYNSTYYEWVPVQYDQCKNWDSYNGYNLVKADSYDQDHTEIYVCLVQFSQDNSYRIGWFDPSVAFVCTVLYQGNAVEASNDTYSSYYLSVYSGYTAYWAGWDELLKYSEDHIVYAPDHDCVPGEVCWTVNSGGGFITYSAPDGTKTDTWGTTSGDSSSGSSGSGSSGSGDSGSGSGSSSGSGSGTTNSKRRRGLANASKGWTRSLGRRDYKPQPSDGSNEYKPPEQYCYIGYGSSVTDYKVLYAYDGGAYQSDDIRYDSNVKALVIQMDYSGSSGSSPKVGEEV